MNACFSPASQVGKARVYFRPETLSTWYYVEMTSDAPCFAGVLLRPSKSLIDKKIFYYVDVQGEGAGRTPEYAPIVVGSEEECRKKLPVAPVSATGPAAIFPSMPAGFVGAGTSTGVIAGGVAAAAVVAGRRGPADQGRRQHVGHDPGHRSGHQSPRHHAADHDHDRAEPPDQPRHHLPGHPRSGQAPLRVDFATFANGATGSYEFEWTFGDGASSNNPNPSHTFVTAGVFNSTVRVLSGDQIASCSRPITVTPPPTPGPGPSPSPSASPSPSPLRPRLRLRLRLRRRPRRRPRPRRPRRPRLRPPATFTLQVTKGGSGSGVVTGPGITCLGLDCTETYPSGTVVNLLATPQSPRPRSSRCGGATARAPRIPASSP